MTCCANDIENKVIGVMAGMMGRLDTEAFHPDAKLVDDLGMDSLDLAEIELELEDQLGIEWPTDGSDGPAPETVGDFIAQVRKLMEKV